MRLTSPAARRGWWAESLLLAVAYYALGRVAWHLGAAPGHAVALWPSAGLTLGLLLVRSPKILLGAAIGGFALGLQAFFPSQSGIGWPRALIVAGGFAAAGVLEPLMAAVLVQRLSRMRTALAETRDVARFALLAGPAPALIGAGLSNGALYWAKVLPRDRLLESFGVWWLGDLLGLLAFAPVVLLLGAGRAEVPYLRRTAVALTVGAATALAVWVFLRATRWDQRRAEAVVQQRVESITAVVERSLIDHLDALRTLADFIGSSGKVEAVTFQRVTTGAVVRHFAYEALAWAPAPMARKPVLIALVEPREQHEAMAGMDLAADEERRQKMAAARHTGEMFVLPTVANDPRALWLFVPAPGRTGEDGIEGFFGAVLRLDRLIDSAVTGLTREGVGVELREGSAGGRVVHRAPGTPAASGGVGLPRPLELTLAERRYVLVPVVSRAALVAQQSTDVWIVLVAGMFFVVLLEGVMLVITGGRRDLEDTVIETPEVVMLD